MRLTSTDTPDSVFSWVVGGYFQNNVSRNNNTFVEPFDQVAKYLSINDPDDYGYCNPRR
ncbi:MAG: hypothetical protein WDN04_07815 [Rhodospirillales bacterium]